MSTLAGSFLPDHLDDLRKSGLTEETIQAMGVYTVPSGDISKILNWNPAEVRSALAFPYPGTGFIRLKVFPSYQDKRGHLVKYLQPKGSNPHLYLLPAVEAVLQDPSGPLAIAEGEKKAAALLQARIMTAGMGGIWCWLEKETHRLIPEVERIAWVDREVSLYFDSDTWHRPDLLKPVFAFGKEIEERGARVKVVVIEQKSKEKVGIDDLLVARGPEVLGTLKAIPLSHKAFTHAAKWWREWKRRASPRTKAVPADLKGLIHGIRRLPREEALSFEKRQQIARAVTDTLCRSGTLHTTQDRRCYFFNAENRTLLALDDDAFVRFLADLTGLNPVEVEFRYLTEHLLTETHQRGQKTRVYHLAHYDKATHRVFVTDFGSGMWVLNGETISHAPNGEGGILFATHPSARPFIYTPKDKRSPVEETVRSFLEPIRFESTAGPTPQRWKDLLFLWNLCLFFPELHPTKLIPVFIGPQGATKTTTARRFGIQLLGKDFNVGHIEAGDRGEQAFIAAVCSKPFCVYDNADAPIRWLPDRLATFATGQDFELRELYTTNQLSTYRPVANLMLTSRDPHFRRPDVAERLLICRLARPERFIPESAILARTLEQRNGVWSDLLELVNHALVLLKEVPEAPPLPYRMADFASFGWRLSFARGGKEATQEFCQALDRLEEEQARYVTEEDPVAACLEVWLSKEANLGREVETGGLYTELAEIAKNQGLLLPKTSAAFGKRFHSAKRALETALGVRIGVDATTHTSRWIFRNSSASSENFSDSVLPAHPAPAVCGQGGQEGMKA